MNDHTLIPGPLHPDLFGGETPIMLLFDPPPAVYVVEVCWRRYTEIVCRKVNVLAGSDEEAARRALKLESRAGREGIQVVDVQRRLHRPTARELDSRMPGAEQPAARLTAYRRSGHAKVTVYRDGRIRRYRVSLHRYAALREWTNVGSKPWKCSGAWMRHGIDVYFWNKAEVRS